MRGADVGDPAKVVLAVDVYNDKIKHLLKPSLHHWVDRIKFRRINIKNDPRFEGIIKISDLVHFLNFISLFVYGFLHLEIFFPVLNCVCSLILNVYVHILNNLF